MGDLSKHFSRQEFTCHCGCGKNTADPALVRGLELLRASLPKLYNKARPLYIGSGCRCEKHNRRVGGAPGSQHLYGRAADVYTVDVTPKELYLLANKIPHFKKGGIGIYPLNGFIHVDVRPNGPSRWGWGPNGQIPLQQALEME